MLRGIAVLITALASTGVGIAMAERLRRRMEALGTACGCVRRILLAIAHTDRTLPEILRSLDGPDILMRTAAGMEAGMPLAEAWAAASEAAGLVPGTLTEADMAQLDGLGAVLGRTCRASQLEYGEMVLAALEERCGEAEEAYAKKGRVYRTMGAVLGAGLAILLI